MALYLNNLDLNGNQLIKATIHPLGTAPASAQEGQIYYDTGDNVIYVNTSTTVNSPSWKSIGGDITGVSFTTDDSTTISDTSGDAAFTIAGGTGITTSSTGSTVTITVDTLNQNTTGSAGSVANALTVDNTTVKLNTGTTYNGSAALTLSAKTAAIANGGAALATADQIHTFVTTQTDAIAADTSGNAATVTNGVYTTGNQTIGGTKTFSSTISGDISGNAATVTTNANLTGHITSSGNTTSLGSFTTAQLNAAISDGSINSQTLPTDFVSAASGGTFSGNVSFGDNNISNVGDIAVDSISADNTNINIGNQDSKSIILGKTHPSGTTNGTSVSVEQDLNVKGKLVVQGDIETSSTTNTEIKDAIIQITGAAANTANTSDIGFVFERGSSGNVAFAWDEGANPGAFKLIATGDTASSADITMTQQGGENNDENTAGGTAPKGYQTLYAGIIRSVGAAGTSGFYGDGANITGITAANISAGTLAVARGGTGVSSMTALKNELDGETWTFANAISLTGGFTLDGNTITGVDDSGEFTNDDAHIMTSAAVEDKILSYGYTTNTGTTQAGNTQTFTNKSIDADNNTLSNIEVDNFKASAVVIESEGIGSNDNDTTIPTSAAVKDYVDSQTSSSGNTGGRQAFSLANAGSVAATNSGKTFTITHGMGASLNYGVEVIRAANGSGETVYTDVTRTTTTIVIDFAVAPTSGDYTALVCKY